MTKLTLSVEETTLARAKELARARNTSVSAMFSQFVRSMAGKRGRGSRIGPLTREMSGIVKLPRKGYRDLLADSLADKYGLPK